ncbi:hypothetical protein GQ43DRAFT_492339 [Delitschia confertaspora ATCC 74209]|uniref:Uncharacterized protein n=1 Tax=Delitschia confertaspora ATCC 74209 TaxID=1513339 RepID=A0A9P4JGZ8_9PLEO|nr:hypothetical protein GQ43DRAFT_492339 [Delitschia confertaspora ATCC 74209]
MPEKWNNPYFNPFIEWTTEDFLVRFALREYKARPFKKYYYEVEDLWDELCYILNWGVPIRDTEPYKRLVEIGAEMEEMLEQRDIGLGFEGRSSGSDHSDESAAREEFEYETQGSNDTEDRDGIGGANATEGGTAAERGEGGNETEARDNEIGTAGDASEAIEDPQSSDGGPSEDPFQMFNDTEWSGRPVPIEADAAGVLTYIDDWAAGVERYLSQERSTGSWRGARPWPGTRPSGRRR